MDILQKSTLGRSNSQGKDHMQMSGVYRWQDFDVYGTKKPLEGFEQDVFCVEDYNLKRQGRSKKASQMQNVVKQVSYNNGLDQGGHGGEGQNRLDSGCV